MRAGRRSLGLAATIVLLGVVVVVGLAVITIVAFPVALVIELGVLALVAGVASRAMTRRERRRARKSDPLWVTRWESEPPVEAVPLTRRQLSVVLGEWGLTGEAYEDVLLVVTELLSNAVDHGRGPVRLTVELRTGSVRVEVHDTAPDPPRPQPLDPYAVRGRGLQMVEALSSEWGWSNGPVGKIVWADVPSV